MYKIKTISLRLLCLFLIFCGQVEAKNITATKITKTKFAKIAQEKKLNKEAFLVIDEKNNKILYNKYADKRRHPASLTKMLTLYITFDTIHQKKLRMNQKMITSAYAASKPRTKLGLTKGEYITVKDAVLGLIIRSANDAAVVLAEFIDGSEPNFAKKMNIYAKKLGMYNSNFTNASGLYDKNQYSSAMDMGKLAIALKRDFPEYYSLFSQTDFEFKGELIRTTNHVVRLYPGAKGMKTGYIEASGFNLVTTAERGNKKLVGVVLGGKTSKIRNNKMIVMLDQHFSGNKNSVVTMAENKAKFTYSKNKSKKNMFPTVRKQNILRKNQYLNKIALIERKKII